MAVAHEQDVPCNAYSIAGKEEKAHDADCTRRNGLLAEGLGSPRRTTGHPPQTTREKRRTLCVSEI